MTALQEEAKQLCRQNTQIYTTEIFYSEVQGFLEAFATRETSLPLEGGMFPADPAPCRTEKGNWGRTFVT